VIKLKQHLLPRIQQLEKNDASVLDTCTQDTLANGNSPSQQNHNHVLIRKDVMYRHKLARINYTTYEVRRAQDVINPDTSRCNVMVLNTPQDDGEPCKNPFSYAQVIGIFHVQAFLADPAWGIVDCRLRRLDFLWVRWYCCVSTSNTWETGDLDRVQFPPISEEGAFGFLDPRDVLRASHIIPVFAMEQIHEDGIGLSGIAKDCRDWRSYYINRYFAFLRAQ
jgi:hypothetical protein